MEFFRYLSTVYGLGVRLDEAIATFGLVMVISLASRFRAEAIPMVVAAYITSAYWFTSSTSFANPAVTFARAMTDTFAGIAPRSVPLFIAAQLIGGVLATFLSRCSRLENLRPHPMGMKFN